MGHVAFNVVILLSGTGVLGVSRRTLVNIGNTLNISISSCDERLSGKIGAVLNKDMVIDGEDDK